MCFFSSNVILKLYCIFFSKTLICKTKQLKLKTSVGEKEKALLQTECFDNCFEIVVVNLLLFTCKDLKTHAQ